MKLYFFESDDNNPYRNLALERYLTLRTAPKTRILFLWQNRNTVVIGRNQNCYGECNIAEIEDGGGLIARRLSGGGAVFHDLGNLNFSFIASRDMYDVERQLGIIVNAVNSLGLPYMAEKTGRNDIEIDGAKFSGNAFIEGDNCCHHGTILISADFAKLASYLNVSEGKLAAKGVKSVRSRVVNLSELGEVSVPAMKKALHSAFEKEYAAKSKPLLPGFMDEDEVVSLTNFFSEKNWIYNREHIDLCMTAPLHGRERTFPWCTTVPLHGDEKLVPLCPSAILCSQEGKNPEPLYSRELQYKVARRFDWGHVEIGFNMVEEQISEIRIYTDALDGDLAEILENTFTSFRLGGEHKGTIPSFSRREIADVYKAIYSTVFLFTR